MSATKLKPDDDIEDADDQPEIDVEIVDDTPEQDRGKKVAPLTTESPVEDDNDEEIKGLSKRVQERISTLTARYHQERRAKELAARQIDEQTNVIKKTIEDRNRLADLVNRGEGVWKETNKSKIEAMLANARREFREAYEAGDADKLADAQQKITKHTVELENTINWRPQPLAKVEVPRGEPTTRPVDPKASDWHSKNDWFGRDNRLTAYSLGLHQELMEKGFKADSDEYFSTIDKEMRTAFPDKFPRPNGSGTAARASVVAPAGRVNPKASRQTVRITTSMKAVADRLGVPVEEYAKEWAKLNNDQ